ncbi:E3 ubiquitin/ISG15 ligase TRIM25-like [Hoplias malabaricus]|uniref:E3 ubiquitin/ISG15 ligase TRIM25-like n=1 Tax=Hoplias malabaricus TaxID=27720 RepID=UPI003462519E
MAQPVEGHFQDCFFCSVCLDVLENPVTIPCGHSFCMTCIGECWAEEELKNKAPSCPQCRSQFSERPALNKNTVLSEVLRSLSVSRDTDKNAEVKLNSGECHFCSGEKRRAVKSCLTCVASFCETHLRTHHDFPVFQAHTLVEPCSRLQEKMCSVHHKVLDVFCVQDQRCICLLCAMDDHSDHKTVSAAKQWAEQQKPLQILKENLIILQLQRKNELQALNKAVEACSTTAQAAVKINKDFVTEITGSLEGKLSQISRMIQYYEKNELGKAEKLKNKLEQKIACLKLGEAEGRQLGPADDPILSIQKLLSLSAFWERERPQSNPVRENPSFLDSTALLSGLKEQLEKLIDEKIKEMMAAAAKIKIILPANPKTRQEFQEHFCKLKLSPESSHSVLKLSEENRKVEFSSYTNTISEVTPNAQRFTSEHQVLCDSPVKGCCFWEVTVTGTVHVALSYGSIVRNGWGDIGKFGYNDLSWSLECNSNSCRFRHNCVATEISVYSLKKVGVYLDKGAGILAFYKIGDYNEFTLLHRTQTTFTKLLYPGFRLLHKSSVSLC